MLTELEKVQDAIRWIDSDDRETWIAIGQAIHSEFGDEGRETWIEWSRKSSKYVEKDAFAAWRSFKSGKGRGIGTLFYLATQYGWDKRHVETYAEHAQDDDDLEKRMQERQRIREKHQKLASESMENARFILDNCVMQPHQYLKDKGFVNKLGMVFDGKVYLSEYPFYWEYRNMLVVPVRSADRERKLMSIQMISPSGDKKFLPHLKVRGGTAIIGNGKPKVYTEGFATGMSIMYSLKSVGVNPQVIVAFSAANVPIAIKGHGAGYVIADRDRIDMKGERYAKISKMPYWLPPDIPEISDANDCYKAYGAVSTGQMLKKFMKENRQRRGTQQR